MVEKEMNTNNDLHDSTSAHFDRTLREKFARCVEKVAPPAGVWKKILEKVKRALETGEWPDDLDEEDFFEFGNTENLLKNTTAIWIRN